MDANHNGNPRGGAGYETNTHSAAGAVFAGGGSAGGDIADVSRPGGFCGTDISI